MTLYMKRCQTSLIIREMQNQNHNEILPHPCQDSCQKQHNCQMLASDIEKKATLLD